MEGKTTRKRTKKIKDSSIIKYGALEKTVTKKQRKDYAPMLEGPATNKFDMAHSRQLTFLDISNEAIIENNGLTIMFDEYKKGELCLRPSTQKLFDVGVLYLTKANNFKDDKVNTEVTFSVKDYARMLGYDVEEKIFNNSEQQIKEKKRISRVLDKVKVKVKEDLRLLRGMYLSWNEDIKGTPIEFSELNIFQQCTLMKGGIIFMDFSVKIASYLNNAYITQYPLKLLTLDERIPLTIQLGRKLASYHGITNNQKRGTNNRIQIKTLIKNIGSLMSFEEVQKIDPGHWERRIRDPLEKSLDNLVGKGILKCWELCNAKGTVLTDLQMQTNDYKVYSEFYIKFEMN